MSRALLYGRSRRISATGSRAKQPVARSTTGHRGARRPTLCGIGPVGGNPHRDDEWCRIDTMFPRAQALALTILQVPAA